MAARFEVTKVDDSYYWEYINAAEVSVATSVPLPTLAEALYGASLMEGSIMGSTAAPIQNLTGETVPVPEPEQTP